MNGSDEILQFQSVNDDAIRYSLYHRGNSVKLSVYTESQYQYKKYMPEPAQIDYTKSIISPMPGAIVSIDVQPGDEVEDGQQLCIIEAMKMQNVLKSEISGTIKKVNVKAGDSVVVDEVLIEFV